MSQPTVQKLWFTDLVFSITEFCNWKIFYSTLLTGTVLKLFSTYFFASLFSTNPTSNGLGLNPALRGDRPAKNFARDGMAPGLSEDATEERSYTLWPNFEFC